MPFWSLTQTSPSHNYMLDRILPAAATSNRSVLGSHEHVGSHEHIGSQETLLSSLPLLLQETSACCNHT